MAAKSKPKSTSSKAKSETTVSGGTSNYPRHTLERALRIPESILNQNAGKECSEQDAAKFIGVKFNKGPFTLEISSCVKYGLLEKPSAGKLRITELSRNILRPQKPSDKIAGLRKAVMNAPVISDIYNHYRGENFPDDEFFNNALIERFKVPSAKISEVKSIFFSCLDFAQLFEEHGGKKRILDLSESITTDKKDDHLKKLEKNAGVVEGDTCFVMMPFANPVGSYYEKIYEKAIIKAGLRPVRADNEIFSTGKIIDQVWEGINNAKVLVAELTNRNPNVFYELGLAHALEKPVVLVSSNDNDVPFDLKHIRVIYYDVTDPFWGQKLMDKVAENILSALQSPQEAIFKNFKSDDKKV